MGNLVLDSLEIQGFRGFRHLQIEKLGRVNLIVGKNNVGKSSLLEALQIYARRGDIAVLWEILKDRDEYIEDSSSSIPEIERKLTSLKYLFYGRETIFIHSEPMHIGPISASNDTMTLGLGWYIFQENGDVSRKIQLKNFEDYNGIDNLENRIYVRLGTNYTIDYPLRNTLGGGLRLSKDPKKITSVTICVLDSYIVRTSRYIRIFHYPHSRPLLPLR